jgi:hypothetical protein
MKILIPPRFVALAVALLCSHGLAAQEPASTPKPEVLDLKFGTEASANGKVPAWFVGVQQVSGIFQPKDGGWKVDSTIPFGAGKLVLVLDRAKIDEDLALSLFYLQKDADLAIQLYDDEDRVVAVDLFANVVNVNEDAKTDTAIVPLRRFPTASKIVIRRLRGEINVQGAVLFPVISEATTDHATLLELARRLGDPLSEKNPLMTGFASTNQKVTELQMKAAQNAVPAVRESSIKVLQDSSEVTASKRKPVLLQISGKIDGSEEIHIDQQGASWVHKHWSQPTGVRINGVEWNPALSSRLLNEGPFRFLPQPVDFLSAKVLLAKGRDVCAMVPTKDGVIVFLADSPNGASDYEMTIAFEAR